MAGRFQPDPHRDRRQVRRILADLRVRWSDLPALGFHSELSPVIDGNDRLAISGPLVFVRSRS